MVRAKGDGDGFFEMGKRDDLRIGVRIGGWEV